MARIIPEFTKAQIVAEHGSEAEANVYAALRDSLPGHVTVLYSVPWVDSTSKNLTRDGEADFVVIDPTKGILVLEAKGGSVEISPGGQWFTRRDGGTLVGITNPFRQGVVSKNVLKREISSITGFDTYDLNFAHGVVLPDVFNNPGNLGPDAPIDILVLGNELENIETRIDDIFDYWSSAESMSFDTEHTDVIIERIFPRRVLAPSLGATIRDTEEQIVELTRQQCRYLGFLGSQKRVCIEGPAGTGKTVLAFEKAKQLAESGIPTLLTCFSNRLAAQLLTMAESVPNLSVWTFHDACWQLAEEAGLALPASGTDLDSEFFDTTLPGLLWKALDLLPNRRFGAVIIDEAQDLEFEWWELLELMLTDADEGWLWAFRDPGQDLFERDTGLASGMQVYPLSENVRNTRQIHDAAAQFAPHDPGVSTGPEGSEVLYELATNKRASARVVGRVLHRLINDEGLNREDVLILTASSVQKSSLAGIEKVGSFELKSFGTEGNGVDIESVWRFKGLERAAIIVVDMLESTENAVRYVAMTRAKSVLVIVGEHDIVPVDKSFRQAN